MPSETDQKKMWTNYDHDHVRPHIRGGLKKQLSPQKKSGAGDEDDDVCPPVKDRLIQACHRLLISSTYISSRTNRDIFGRKRKKSKLKKWPETILGSSRTESRCSIKSRQSPRNSLRWGIHHFISPGQIYAWLWTWFDSYLLLALDFIFCMLLKVRFKSVGF